MLLCTTIFHNTSFYKNTADFPLLSTKPSSKSKIEIGIHLHKGTYDRFILVLWTAWFLLCSFRYPASLKYKYFYTILYFMFRKYIYLSVFNNIICTWNIWRITTIIINISKFCSIALFPITTNKLSFYYFILIIE